MQYHYNSELITATAPEFTEAVNASFIPVSRLGASMLMEAYNLYSDQLPIAPDRGHEIKPPLDGETITALNALHALTKARQEALSRLDPTIPAAEHILAITARVDVADVVVTAQQYIAQRAGGRYIDTSLTGR